MHYSRESVSPTGPFRQPGVSQDVLADAGVAALSGTAFGRYGEGFLRFSYANSVENIEAALEAVRANLAGVSSS